MKFIDWLIILAFFACLLAVYAGFRVEGALATVAVAIVASWRFYDSSREKHMLDGHSGDNLSDAPDSMLGNMEHHADSSHDSSSSNNDN
jgi:hypothetical protein